MLKLTELLKPGQLLIQGSLNWPVQWVNSRSAEVKDGDLRAMVGAGAVKLQLIQLGSGDLILESRAIDVEIDFTATDLITVTFAGHPGLVVQVQSPEFGRWLASG